MFVMRLLGVGLHGVNLFCALMNMSHGFSNKAYYTFLENLHCAAKSVFELVQQKAVKEEIEKNTKAENESSHLSISMDLGKNEAFYRYLELLC